MTEASFDLRKARLNAGFSRRRAAQAIGVGEYVLRRLEEGQRVHPAKAKRVADYFGIQVTDLAPFAEAAA